MSVEVPWEPLAQITPDKLAESHNPRPWKDHHRGNGHFDVVDADGELFAHVYCWSREDYKRLGEVIDKGNKDET